MVKLIVGLGNPGRQYANNRHNIGFRCVDGFARRNGIVLKQRLAKSLVGEVLLDTSRVVVAKPRTFMNLSGEAVCRLAGRYNLAPEDILAVYDDLDLPLGKIRIREKGGSGGHKGLKSIIDRLGTQDFARLRVGIAPIDPETASDREDAIGYVLGDFTREEKAIVEEVCSRVAEAISCYISLGAAAAMNRFNSRL